jgi:cytoskeletal protein CcmA (bactofilin family)
MSFGKFKDDNEKIPSAATSAPSQAATNTGRTEAFLGKGTKVVGTLSFNGPVELDGAVEGEIQSKDTLTIGESAIIHAKIHGAEITIKGTVTGDIVATKRLAIKRPARVTGNIASPTLSIEDGVQFEGRCSMTTAEARSVEAKVGAPGASHEKGVGAAA